jgi:hypothetical protein
MTAMMTDKNKYLIGHNKPTFQEAHTSLLNLKMDPTYQEVGDHARMDARLFNAALETMLFPCWSRG